MTYLVDVPKVVNKTLKGKKDPNGEWSYDTKLTVASIILQTQNLRAASDITEVPYKTIQWWIEQDFWPDILRTVQKQQRAELNSRLSRIVDTALSKIEDRLENGDFILNNKTGEVVRKPVSLRDANQVAKDLLGQQLDIQKLDRDSLEIQSSITDVLKQLAQDFAKFNSKLKKNNAEDIQFVDIAEVKES